MNNNALAGYVSRIERLAEEKKGLQADIAEIFKEAKAAGFEAPIIREVLKRRQMTEHELREKQQKIEAYEAAIGALAGTELGDAGRP